MSKELTGFPSLQAAVISKLTIGDASPLGTLHNGSKMIHFVTPTGTIESVPGFEPAFKATVHFGADWLSFDPDGQYARIDLRAVARTDQGHPLDFRYQGIIALSSDARKIFEGAPDAKTIPFGCTTGSVNFLVADPSLKLLENSMFATNARIIVHEAGLTVETRMSLVVASTDMD